MPIPLRILLFVFSLFSMLFVIRRIRKAQVQLYDMTFWLFLAVLFVIMSIFPELAIGLAKLIGVQSPVNFVYLVIIFFLLAHCFMQSLRFSRLEAQFKRFVEEDALKNAEEDMPLTDGEKEGA